MSSDDTLSLVPSPELRPLRTDPVREQRGRLIAAGGRIRRSGGMWVVPSETDTKTYAVDIEREDPTCTCPDHELRKFKCKHQHAVEFFILSQSVETDEATGATIETTIAKSVRVTYPQNWPAYNAAQTNEGERVATLLRDLCAGIAEPPRVGPKGGRPRLPLRDVVFSAVQKVYGTQSGRRAQSDLRAAQATGLVEKAPHYNSVFRAFEDPRLTPVLSALVIESAKPLAAVEHDFAVDSTGFSTCTYQRWFDVKHGRQARRQSWLKLHIATGVKTNVVTAAKVTDPDAGDSPEFKPLVAQTAAHFSVEEVSGDKAYLSRGNLAAVETMGARVFIPFKANSAPFGNGGLWQRLYHFFAFNRDEFLTHYHKRSNVESTMWMLKSKFGGSLRSKTVVAQTNELLCKVIAHNLAVLVSAFYELGIKPEFWGEAA